MPAGTIPCGCPASHTAFHSFAPSPIGTYSSQPRSPTYEIRDASTSRPSTETLLQVLNGKPSLETSSDVIDARMSRARGPHRPTVHQVDVRSSICALPARLSANHFLSAMPWAPPVTTRNRSSSIFMIVRSDLNPPLGVSTGV